MYILSIIICKQENIKLVVDGARKCQMFAIEQDKMIKEFEQLFQNFDLEISFPLLYETDDFSIKNKILAHGFIPKMNEVQCLLGMPILNHPIDEEIINGCFNIYRKELFPKVEDVLKHYETIKFTGDYL